jgi:hypothetical protein
MCVLLPAVTHSARAPDEDLLRAKRAAQIISATSLLGHAINGFSAN